MREKHLGSLAVSAQGLGCNNLTGNYGTTFDETLARATLDRALDLGVQLLDTSDVYGPHINEEFLGRALHGRRQRVVLSTKFGTLAFGGMVARGTSPLDQIRADPAYTYEACDASLRRLKTDYIDLYYLHRADPKVPIEETVGAMSNLVQQGKVRFIGLSEVAPATLRRAVAIHPISAIENEWSLWSRDIEDETLGVARELHVGIVTYAPLGRGFLTGQIKSEADFRPGDSRRHNPRFQGENFKKNLELVSRIEELARNKGCSPAQLALAWLDSRGDDVVPIPGGDRPEFVEENVGALNVELSEQELARIDAAMPRDSVAGDRYADMRWVGGTTPATRTD
jgi:aryl-alcohol dehydrogenase-like predicted oxidoreductase